MVARGSPPLPIFLRSSVAREAWSVIASPILPRCTQSSRYLHVNKSSGRHLSLACLQFFLAALELDLAARCPPNFTPGRGLNFLARVWI